MANKFKMTFQIEVTDVNIRDIMAEISTPTGIWCDYIKHHGKQLHKSDSGQILKGGELLFHNQIDNVNYVLYRDRLCRGLKRYLENPIYGNLLEFDSVEECKLCVDSTRINEDVADAIIQCALFERVRYGHGVETT